MTTAQELQNALTLAAANGADDNIYLAAGYYTGNFNFNSAENRALLLQGEAGTTNTQISIDGAGTGRDMNLANTGTGNFTVRGITFLRNCGSTTIGALRIAGGTGSTLLVDSCRFLSPTNPGAVGIGLDITSGQNATVTNCIVNGRTVSSGIGVQVFGITGNVSFGGCNFVTNGNPALNLSCDPVTVTINANSFLGNLAGASIYTSTALVTFLNNNADGNGYGANLRGVNHVVAGNLFKNSYQGVGCSAAAVGSGSFVLSNNVFANNSGLGAQVSTWPSGAPSTVSRNTFTGNNDGGLRCSGDVVNAIIVGNTFTGNLRGGGVRCDGPSTITSNIFIGNSSSTGLGYGGGLTCSAAATVTGNTFVGNTSAVEGGGAYFVGNSAFVLTKNVFLQNSASEKGGGIYLGDDTYIAQPPTVTLVDNLVVKNSSSQGGGICVSPSSRLTMINNTLSGNSSTGNGGGLACSISGTSEVLDVYNNIIWGNSASGNGADVWLAGTGSKKTFLYNDVHGMYGVWDIAANLLDVAPAFFDPVNGDYHLRSTSPCINAGTNGAPSLPAFDLDGNPRTNGTSVDLGCYEFNNTRFHPADVNQDWVISATEYANYAAAWKNNQAWPTGPNPIPADYVTRAGFLQNQGGTYHNDGAGAPLGWKPGAN